MCSCLDSSVGEVSGCGSRGCKFSSPLCLLKEPAYVALGKLHSPRMPPEDGNGKPLLSPLCLENPEKDLHNLEFKNNNAPTNQF